MILSHRQSRERPRSDEAQHSVSDQSLPASNILARPHLKAKENLITIAYSTEILLLRFLCSVLACKDLCRLGDR